MTRQWGGLRPLRHTHMAAAAPAAAAAIAATAAAAAAAAADGAPIGAVAMPDAAAAATAAAAAAARTALLAPVATPEAAPAVDTSVADLPGMEICRYGKALAVQLRRLKVKKGGDQQLDLVQVCKACRIMNYSGLNKEKTIHLIVRHVASSPEKQASLPAAVRPAPESREPAAAAAAPLDSDFDTDDDRQEEYTFRYDDRGEYVLPPFFRPTLEHVGLAAAVGLLPACDTLAVGIHRSRRAEVEMAAAELKVVRKKRRAERAAAAEAAGKRQRRHTAEQNSNCVVRIIQIYFSDTLQEQVLASRQQATREQLDQRLPRGGRQAIWEFVTSKYLDASFPIGPLLDSAQEYGEGLLDHVNLHTISDPEMTPERCERLFNEARKAFREADSRSQVSGQHLVDFMKFCDGNVGAFYIG